MNMILRFHKQYFGKIVNPAAIILENNEFLFNRMLQNQCEITLKIVQNNQILLISTKINSILVKT